MMTIVEKELTESFVKRVGFRKDASVKIYDWFKKRDMDFGGIVHYFIYEPSKFIGLFMSILNDDLNEFGVDMLKELSSKYSYKNSKEGKVLVMGYINKI